MGLENVIFSIFGGKKKQHEVDILKLPSQGYFYPDGLEMYINKGDIDDQLVYQHGVSNSNIFGIISTIKSILAKRIDFNIDDFEFDRVRAIDVFFLFIEFIKYTTGSKIYFEGVEFSKKNFVYFDFDQFSNNYDKEKLGFVFEDWCFSLPSIGIETSLSEFSYEISMRGKSDQYKDKNYNLIYFLGDKTNLSYKEMISLLDLFEDLDPKDQSDINDIVEKFSKTGAYYLIEKGKKSVSINPTMLKDMWPTREGDIFLTNKS